jgi:hypothetical protein
VQLETKLGKIWSAGPVLPRALSMGLIGAGEIDIDTLEQRLRDAVLSQHAAAASPTMFGIFGRKP